MTKFCWTQLYLWMTSKLILLCLFIMLQRIPIILEQITLFFIFDFLYNYIKLVTYYSPQGQVFPRRASHTNSCGKEGKHQNISGSKPWTEYYNLLFLEIIGPCVYTDQSYTLNSQCWHFEQLRSIVTKQMTQRSSLLSVIFLSASVESFCQVSRKLDYT